MAHPLRRIAPLTLAALAVVTSSASAAPDRKETITFDKQTIQWTGKDAPGANASFTTGSDDCAKAGPDTMCDETLIKIGDDIAPKAASSVKFIIDDYSVAASDFDIRVYNSSATGTQGTLVQTSPTSETYEPLGLGQLSTFPGDEESATARGAAALKPGKHYLVQVVYFASAGTFRGRAIVSDVDEVQPSPTTSTAGLR